MFEIVLLQEQEVALNTLLPLLLVPFVLLLVVFVVLLGML